MLLALMAGVRGSEAASPPAAPESRADAAFVYVIRRRWHVDIGLPADSLEPPLSFLRERFPGARTLIFGFGDERYLLHGHRANILMVLWPGAGVILISALNTTPDAAFGEANVAALPVSAPDSHALQEFIFNSIAVQRPRAARGGSGTGRQRAVFHFCPALFGGLHLQSMGRASAEDCSPADSQRGSGIRGAAMAQVKRAQGVRQEHPVEIASAPGARPAPGLSAAAAQPERRCIDDQFFGSTTMSLCTSTTCSVFRAIATARSAAS